VYERLKKNATLQTHPVPVPAAGKAAKLAGRNVCGDIVYQQWPKSVTKIEHLSGTVENAACALGWVC